jgi:23S rRNA G2445 N2-methylase RlmL
LASTPGSLHPPLAFAMAMLGGVSPGTVVLDPCCGSGTLPIEATRLEPMSIATGVDNNPEAISIAQEYSARARSSSLFLLGDAGALPFADESVDVVLCNPPWARAVTPTGLLKDQPSSFWNELGRVLTSEGRAVLLTPQDLGVEEVVQRVGLRPQRSFSVALFGSWVSVTILGPHTRQRAISGDSRFRSEVERWILQSPTFPE